MQNWLSAKSIERRIKPGDFAENITTEGIDWNKIKIGALIRIFPQSAIYSRPTPNSGRIRSRASASLLRRSGYEGWTERFERRCLQSAIVLEITQIGKECHLGCAIRKLVGDCLMPKEGVFAKVVKGGKIKVGDTIKIIADDHG